MKIKHSLLFSILLALTVTSLDTLIHFIFDYSVHLYYFSIKLVIIFLTTFLISAYSKPSIKTGIITSVSSSIIFFLYYRIYYLIETGSFFTMIPEVGDSIPMVFIHMIIIFVCYYLIIELEENI